LINQMKFPPIVFRRIIESASGYRSSALVSSTAKVPRQLGTSEMRRLREEKSGQVEWVIEKKAGWSRLGLGARVEDPDRGPRQGTRVERAKTPASLGPVLGRPSCRLQDEAGTPSPSKIDSDPGFTGYSQKRRGFIDPLIHFAPASLLLPLLPLPTVFFWYRCQILPFPSRVAFLLSFLSLSVSLVDFS